MNDIIYGIHAVQSLLNYAPQRFIKVFVLNNSMGKKGKRLLPIIKVLHNHGITVIPTNRQFLDKRSKEAAHQGIIACIIPNKFYQEKDLLILISKLDIPFLLILDCITDPHNFGACLRSANAAGVHAVIIPKDRSSQLNAVVHKVACGAAEKIPIIQVRNLVRTIQRLQEENIWIIGTTEKASRTLYQSKMNGKIALVMGSEEKGMRRLTSEHCDELIRIPMSGSISSLNISVATGICLFEAVRQRIFTQIKI